MPDEDRGMCLVALEATDEPALRELVRDGGRPLPASTDASGAARRSSAVRLLARADTPRRLNLGLASFAAGEPSAIVRTAWVEPGAPVAFAFAGQSETRVGMGGELYAAVATFRSVIDRCAAVAHPLLEAALDATIAGDADREALDDARYAQPALFALQVGLAAVWQDWGVIPAAVTGHSLGEYAAACHAGAIALEDAIRLVVRRGSITHEHAQPGTMAVVFCDEQELRSTLRGHEEDVELAAFNAPDVLVVSGRCAGVAEVVATVKARGFTAKPLRISHPFHSVCVDPMLDRLERAAAEVAPGRPAVPFASALEGRVLMPADALDAHYWRRHARAPVRFCQAVAALAGKGLERFLEIGPHSTLAKLGPRCAPGSRWVSSLRRSGHDLATIGEAACELWLTGVNVDLTRMVADLGWRWIDLDRTAAAVD